MTWQNRIVGHDNVPPDQLLAHPGNWRVHPKYQQEALRGVINDIGYIKSVTVNKLTGRVVDGHLRVTLALRDGIPTIPVEYVELTEAEEAEALLTLDPIAALAGSDKDNLETLLAQVQTDDAAVMKLLEDTAADAGLDIHGEPKDAEPQIDRAAELLEKWQVKTGDLWQIGEHRLICGDCTDAAVVGRVMGGEKCNMVFTDPPYGVDYEYADHEDKPDDYENLANSFWKVCPDAPLKMLTVGHKWNNFWFAKNPQGFLIWFDKTKQSPSNVAHLCKSELILVFGKVYKRFAWDTIEVQQPRNDGLRDLHTCPKPLELWQMIIEAQDEARTIYEPFSGSGTTLVACQNLGRRGRAVEISPAYCAVTLERMAQAFPGIEIKRL